MYLYFKGLQTLSEKRKLHLLKYIRGLYFYIGSFALLYGLLGLSSCAFVVYVCAFVGCLCAFVGVTFLKTQTISPLHTLNL